MCCLPSRSLAAATIPSNDRSGPAVSRSAAGPVCGPPAASELLRRVWPPHSSKPLPAPGLRPFPLAIELQAVLPAGCAVPNCLMNQSPAPLRSCLGFTLFEACLGRFHQLAERRIVFQRHFGQHL